MKPSIIPVNDFQKKEFANMLIEYKKKTTVDAFARECKVSVAYMSRLLNCKQANPPILKTLFSISENAGIPFDELGLLAGYSKEDIEAYQKEKPFFPKDFEFHYCIFNALSSAPFEWSELKRAKTGEYHFSLKDCYFSDWIFYNCIDIKNTLPLGLNLAIELTFNQITFTKYNPTTKVSIVVNSKELFDQFVKRTPFSLGLYVSIILIDSDKIIAEAYVPTMLPFNDEINEYVLTNYTGSSQAKNVDYTVENNNT